MFTLISEIPKDVEIQNRLTALHIEEWLKHDVFHLKWWILLFLIFVTLIIWYKMLDKVRLPEICLYALLCTIFVLGLLEYGEELTLWDYPTDIIPIFPPLTSFNLTSLPLIYSLVYQNFNTRKSFISATFIVTAAICFIIEPLLALGGLFQLLRWKYIYSYPFYIAIASFVRVLVIKICTTNEKHNNNQ